MNAPDLGNDELDTICNRVLDELRIRDQALSRELTLQLKAPQFKELTTTQRKFEKIRRLYLRDKILFKSIFEILNVELRAEKISPDNFFDLLDKKMIPLNPFGEITGGNFSSKI